MPKQIPDNIKLKAMELFLQGDKTAKQIAEEVSTAPFQNSGVASRPLARGDSIVTGTSIDG